MHDGASYMSIADLGESVSAPAERTGLPNGPMGLLTILSIVRCNMNYRERTAEEE